MKLAIKLLGSVCGVNAFQEVDTKTLIKGNPDTLYFRLVNQDTPANGGFLRYIPSAPAASVVLTTTGVVSVGINQITALASTTGVAVGQQIIGALIPPGTTVTAIYNDVVLMSAVATGSSVGPESIAFVNANPGSAIANFNYIDSTYNISRVASQAFLGDPSIWSIPILATDKIAPNSLTVTLIDATGTYTLPCLTDLRVQTIGTSHSGSGQFYC